MTYIDNIDRDYVRRMYRRGQLKSRLLGFHTFNREMTGMFSRRVRRINFRASI